MTFIADNPKIWGKLDDFKPKTYRPDQVVVTIGGIEVKGFATGAFSDMRVQPGGKGGATATEKTE